MLTRGVEQELKTRDKQYAELLRQWQTARSKVIEEAQNSGLNHYVILPHAGEDEILFHVFGLRCFARFRHDFHDGTIEYGVLQQNDEGENDRRLQVTMVKFDRLGNIIYPASTGHVKEFEYVHLLILAQHIEGFMKASLDMEKAK
jgi:hypothetical protein